MPGFVAAVLALSACYDPTYQGLLCGSGGSCPRDQTCIACLCVPPDTPAEDIAASLAATEWGEVTMLPGDVNTEQEEDDPSWTDDQRTLVFSRSDGVRAKLFKGTRVSPTAGFEVSPIDELNATAMGNLASPEISLQGETLYFAEDHNGDKQSNLYMSQWTGDHWSIASEVPELSDGETDDGDVAVSPDGLTAMIARNGDMLIATRVDAVNGKFSSTTPLPSFRSTVGTPTGAPSITNNGAMVYFHAGSPRDLYYAWRMTNGIFTAPVPVLELNTVGRDSAPFVSRDGCNLLFAREGNIYQAVRRHRPSGNL